MDSWPSSWRSLGWLSLARDAVCASVAWAWDKAVHQFDSRRTYP